MAFLTSATTTTPSSDVDVASFVTLYTLTAATAAYMVQGHVAHYISATSPPKVYFSFGYNEAALKVGDTIIFSELQSNFISGGVQTTSGTMAGV